MGQPLVRSLSWAAGRRVAIIMFAAVCAACSSDAPRSRLAAVDVARAVGITGVTKTHGENCVADFDGDGRTDLLLSTHDSVWPLMSGTPNGGFRRDPGFEMRVRDRHGCAPADFNGDGLLDVYMSVGACQGECEEPKELWIQGRDHTFTEEAARWGLADPGGRGRVPVVLEANGDGRPDLFTGQETGVDHPSLNRLWVNRGGHFEAAPGPATNELGNLCAAAADVDGDGLDELAVCTPDAGFFVYGSVDGVYADVTDSLGVERVGRRTAEFADVNGDGRPDLATVTRTRVEVLLNEGGRYTRRSLDRAVNDGKDVAFGDVDGDGDLDLYIQLGIETGDADRVLLNNGRGRFGDGVTLPAPASGGGDSVVAIPGWRGDRAAFLVNNGFQDQPGTRQLFEFRGGVKNAS